MKSYIIKSFILLALLFFGTYCKDNTHKFEKYDLKAFSIDIPNNWSYKKKKGIDSFIGIFKNNDQTLYFDYSEIGAQAKIKSTEDYLIYRLWVSAKGCLFCNDSLLNNSGENISSLLNPNVWWVVKVDDNLKKNYPESEYIAKLSVDNMVKVIGFNIPKDFKIRIIEQYVMGNYLVKICEKKSKNKRKTFYASYESLNSLGGLMIIAENIHGDDSKLIIKAFKSVTFPEPLDGARME